MAIRPFLPPHSASNSLTGSPSSSPRGHKKLGSSTSQGQSSRSTKRKSWQTSEAGYFSLPWNGSAEPSNWESNPAPAWSSEAVVAGVTSPTASTPSGGSLFVQDDHLRPTVYEEPPHKYSPASSIRNSIQSVPITTSSLMGSMDSALDHTGLISAHGAAQYNPGLHHSAPPFHSHVPTYPQLTIQTGQLPQPQSPPGNYGGHYQPNHRHAYLPSRDYRYSYGQSYTSPTQAVPPHTIFSPVLQHPHNVTHDYFRHPPTPLYYPDYLTSPTSAATAIPPGLHYGGQHQAVSCTISSPVLQHHNFLAMLQSTVKPLSPSESSYSPPNHDTNKDPSKRKQLSDLDEESDADAPRRKQHHTDGPSSEKSSGKHKLLRGQDNTELQRIREKNKAAQRAYRERRDRRVAELTARTQQSEQALERESGLVAHDMCSPLEGELGKTAQDSRDVVKPDLEWWLTLPTMLRPYGWSEPPPPPKAISDEVNVQAHPERLPAELNFNSPEISTPSVGNFVNRLPSHHKRANGHTNKQGIDHQGHASHLTESPSFSTMPNYFTLGKGKTTGAFEPSASNGVDPFEETLHKLSWRMMDEYGYDANLSQDPNDGSIPPYSDHVPLKHNLPMPELSYSQPQARMITPAGRHTLEFALGSKAFNDTSPLSLNGSRLDPHANSEAPGPDDYMTDWTTFPPTSSRPTSHLKATLTRTRTTHRNQHHQYMDSLLRSKCPKSRIHALNMAIRFRDEHGADEPIPNNLLDELLESTGDGKYIFCCQRGENPRNKTGARDHVRKSLGNLPFRCSNLGCGHSSLRQADRNKHMKICKFPTATFSPNVGWGVQNLEFPALDLSASASLTPQEQTVVDADPLLDITNVGEDIMDSYLAFPVLDGEYDAGIDGAE